MLKTVFSTRIVEFVSRNGVGELTDWLRLLRMFPSNVTDRKWSRWSSVSSYEGWWNVRLFYIKQRTRWISGKVNDCLDSVVLRSALRFTVYRTDSLFLSPAIRTWNGMPPVPVERRTNRSFIVETCQRQIPIAIAKQHSAPCPWSSWDSILFF